MKRIFLFVLLLFTFGCTHYFVRDSSGYNLTKEELEFLKSKKIGLIGFYPYKYITERSSYYGDLETENLKFVNELYIKIIRFVNNNTKRKTVLSEEKNELIQFTTTGKGTHKTIASFDKENQTRPFLNFGKELNALKGKTINNSIKIDDLKFFLSEYLLRTKHLGLEELEPLLSFRENSQNKNESISMKNFDIDYWVMACHGAAIQERNNNVSLKTLLTVIPGFITLGTIPVFS